MVLGCWCAAEGCDVDIMACCAGHAVSLLARPVKGSGYGVHIGALLPRTVLEWSGAGSAQACSGTFQGTKVACNGCSVSHCHCPMGCRQHTGSAQG
jgi:hypothetical protein